jgi:hypothetical protein
MAEMKRAKAPWTFNRLDAEWELCFRKGSIKATSIGRFDRWVEYDDSPEATKEWVSKFMGGRGHEL